jgi:hypothetical protein
MKLVDSMKIYPNFLTIFIFAIPKNTKVCRHYKNKNYESGPGKLALALANINNQSPSSRTYSKGETKKK